MSDLSSLDQTFALPADAAAQALTERISTDIQPHEVGFRRLRSATEIARILHLRGEIRLPASALGDSGFATREKKETRPGSSAVSCVLANTSVRSGTCR